MRTTSILLVFLTFWYFGTGQKLAAAEEKSDGNAITKDALMYYDHCLAAAIIKGDLDKNGFPATMCKGLDDIVCASMGYTPSLLAQAEMGDAARRGGLDPAKDYGAKCVQFQTDEISKISARVKSASGYSDDLGPVAP